MSRSNFARGVGVVLLALSSSCGAGGKIQYLCYAATSNNAPPIIEDVSIDADTRNEAESACVKDGRVKDAAKAKGVTGSYSCSCDLAIIGSPTAPSRR